MEGSSKTDDFTEEFLSKYFILLSVFKSYIKILG